MSNENSVLTPEGHEMLLKELHYLENEKRLEIGERIKVAREFGDISENSEYDDAKNEQGRVEARIMEITHILSESQVANDPVETDRVTIGSIVTIDMDGKERVFTIVGAAESDVASGKISNESPVGAALIGKKVGEDAHAISPTNKRINLKIKNIER